MSFYLKQEILDALRARAKAEDVAVSRLISQAVAAHLELDAKRLAKKRLREALIRRPLA